jgi:hypothetical protein
MLIKFITEDNYWEKDNPKISINGSGLIGIKQLGEIIKTLVRVYSKNKYGPLDYIDLSDNIKDSPKIK